MLSTLRIRNLALVADLTIDFPPGLNVITGETGAGKSVIIGALSLLLGERAGRDLIRSGAESCSVEAVFETGGLPCVVPELLETNGIEPCGDQQLIIKRSFTATGANRQFINGSPTTLAVLASLGQWLVDIHGPHDHQSLLHPSEQLEILDAFGGLSQERDKFTALVQEYGSLRRRKAELIVDEKTYAQQLDLLRFQVREIAGANLRVGEETELEIEHSRASNAARLLELAQSALELLAENEDSILERAGAVGRGLHDLSKIDSASAYLAELHGRCVELLGELQPELSHYKDRVDTDPARLRDLEERINLLQALRRKYGSSVAEIVAFGEEVRRKLTAMEHRDEELERLNTEIGKTERGLLNVGNNLTRQRHNPLPQLG